MAASEAKASGARPGTWEAVPLETIAAVCAKLAPKIGQLVPCTYLNAIPVALVASLERVHVKKTSDVEKRIIGYSADEALDLIANGIGIKPRSAEDRRQGVGSLEVVQRIMAHIQRVG